MFRLERLEGLLLVRRSIERFALERRNGSGRSIGGKFHGLLNVGAHDVGAERISRGTS